MCIRDSPRGDPLRLGGDSLYPFTSYQVIDPEGVKNQYFGEVLDKSSDFQISTFISPIDRASRELSGAAGISLKAHKIFDFQ